MILTQQINKKATDKSVAFLLSHSIFTSIIQTTDAEPLLAK